MRRPWSFGVTQERKEIELTTFCTLRLWFKRLFPSWSIPDWKTEVRMMENSPGNWEEANALFDEALQLVPEAHAALVDERAGKVSGPKHPDVAITAYKLAAVVAVRVGWMKHYYYY
jgi:hypothetical protein